MCSSKLLMRSDFRRILILLTPFTLVGLVGSILESNWGYLIKIFLLFLVSSGLNITAYTAFDER